MQEVMDTVKEMTGLTVGDHPWQTGEVEGREEERDRERPAPGCVHAGYTVCGPGLGDSVGVTS